MFESPQVFTPGLLHDKFDPRDIYLDELELAGDVEIPAKYLIADLDFEPQGAYPYCVSFAVTKILEWKGRKQNKENYAFSQSHLFHHSNGSRVGSYFTTNLETARTKGCIDYGLCPMPDNLWEVDFDREQKKAKSIPFTDAKKLTGYARVISSSDEIKKALLAHGPLLVGVAASGGYWGEYAKRPANSRDNHAVVLAGWNEKGWIIFDSLQPQTGFNGYHTLARDYFFPSVFAVVELPNDWKKKLEDKRSEGYERCLNHYGQPRNYPKELEVAGEMVKEFQAFNNQSVWEMAGKHWSVYTNAIVYGGYSLSYKKWGMWQPGDVINDCYNYRRTDKHIFDFNLTREEWDKQK